VHDLYKKGVKKANFKDITNKYLAFAVNKLNHRPRKCFNYQTPYKIIYGAIQGVLAKCIIS